MCLCVCLCMHACVGCVFVIVGRGKCWLDSVHYGFRATTMQLKSSHGLLRLSSCLCSQEMLSVILEYIGFLASIIQHEVGWADRTI